MQAAASGVVAKTLQYGGLGRAVYVSHGFGVTTIYGHLSRVLVRPGQKVERGDLVGLVGNTGRATGYHLHYEVQQDGQPGQPDALPAGQQALALIVPEQQTLRSARSERAPGDGVAG